MSKECTGAESRASTVEGFSGRKKGVRADPGCHTPGIRDCGRSGGRHSEPFNEIPRRVKECCLGVCDLGGDGGRLLRHFELRRNRVRRTKKMTTTAKRAARFDTTSHH